MAKGKVTRREFLQYAEIAGFAALAAPWLAGCGAPAPVCSGSAEEAAAVRSQLQRWKVLRTSRATAPSSPCAVKAAQRSL